MSIRKNQKPKSDKPNIKPPGQAPQTTGRNKSKSIGFPGIKKFKLSQLKPSEYNPRIIDNETLQSLTNSISHFGCVEPIVVNIRNGSNIIIGGHQRYQALRQLGVKECICMTVDCSKAEEKLLNLTLNNPKIQGRFIGGLEFYIDELKKELPEYLRQLDLQIDQLQKEIAINPEQNVTLDYKEEKIKPYQKTHVLISFDPEKLVDILSHLEAIIREPGIEYEQSSN